MFAVSEAFAWSLVESRARARAHQPGLRAELQNIGEEAAEPFAVAGAEAGDRRVVGRLTAGDHAEGEVVDQVALDLARRARAPIPRLAPVTKATGLSCITNLPLIELAGSGLDLCGRCTLVRLGVPAHLHVG